MPVGQYIGGVETNCTTQNKENKMDTIIVDCNYDDAGTYTVRSHPGQLWGDDIECADIHEAMDEAEGMKDNAAAEGVTVKIVRA